MLRRKLCRSLYCADEPEIEAARALRSIGVKVDALKADLATVDGVDRLIERSGLANGTARGRPFWPTPGVDSAALFWTCVATASCAC
jgi:hypothetical protein